MLKVQQLSLFELLLTPPDYILLENSSPSKRFYPLDVAVAHDEESINGRELYNHCSRFCRTDVVDKRIGQIGILSVTFTPTRF